MRLKWRSSSGGVANVGGKEKRRPPRRLGRAAAGRRIEIAGDPARALAPEDLDCKGLG